MTPIPILQDGLVLLHTSNPDLPSPTTDTPTQVLRLNLAQQTTEAILKTLRNDQQVKLRFGPRVTIQCGSKSELVHASPEFHHSELFRGADGIGDPLYFSGNFSHKIEMRKAQQATAKTDEALATLENTLKSVREHRVSNEARLITDRDELRRPGGQRKGNYLPSPLFPKQASAIRKDHLGITLSTPSSPYQNASGSPGLGPTSVPVLASGRPSKERIRQDAMRIPLLHLLAVRPLSPKNIALQLRASLDECNKLLDKVAKDFIGPGSKKELKDKSYKELDVWKFPYPSQEERQAVIERAVHAFDRMRIGRSDSLWQLLFPKDRRGTGECLSKLNFDQPVNSLTPKVGGQHYLQDGNANTRAGTDNENERGRLAVVMAQGRGARAKSCDSPRKKKVSEKEASSKRHVRSKAVKGLEKVAGKSSPKTEKRSAKRDKKFKSSEVIEDSDEEVKAAKSAVLRDPPPLKRKRTLEMLDVRPASPKEPRTPSAEKSMHKSKLSTSSVSGISSTVHRLQSGPPFLKKQLSADREELLPSKISPRHRTGSSPQKPSPLASSPPTNATDLDNSSSGKQSSQSSAVSSPPSNSDTQKVQSGSSVVKAEETALCSGRIALKRKLEVSDELPQAKRQQVNGVYHIPVINGEVPHLARFQSSGKTSASENDSVSSPDKRFDAFVALNEKSRRFKQYYQKYKDMHARILASIKKEESELRQLNVMHERIKGLKQEIWDDWKKLDKDGL